MLKPIAPGPSAPHELTYKVEESLVQSFDTSTLCAALGSIALVCAGTASSSSRWSSRSSNENRHATSALRPGENFQDVKWTSRPHVRDREAVDVLS